MAPESIDAAVVDYKLPDGSGVDFGRELIERHGKPVIAITGIATEERGAGVEENVEVLEKPFAMVALLAAVERARRSAG